MSEVVYVIRVLPKGIEIDVEGLKQRIKEKIESFGKLNEIRDEPFCFGLKQIKVSFSCDEGFDWEKEIKGIEGVGSVEVLHFSRV